MDRLSVGKGSLYSEYAHRKRYRDGFRLAALHGTIGINRSRRRAAKPGYKIPLNIPGESSLSRLFIVVFPAEIPNEKMEKNKE